MTAKERYEQAHGTGTGECTIPRGTYNRDRTGSTLIMEMFSHILCIPCVSRPFVKGTRIYKVMRKSFL